MKKIFNYNKFNNEVQDTLVESFSALVNAQLDGKGNTAEYADLNKQFNYDFMKECCAAIPNYNVENFSLEDLKNPMLHNDVFMTHRFNAILAQMITPTVPQIVAQGYEDLYDVVQCGWGSLKLRPVC